MYNRIVLLVIEGSQVYSQITQNVRWIVFILKRKMYKTGARL